MGAGRRILMGLATVATIVLILKNRRRIMRSVIKSNKKKNTGITVTEVKISASDSDDDLRGGSSSLARSSDRPEVLNHHRCDHPDSISNWPATAGCMPPDMVREILSRLPPELVLRYRAVCKGWHSLTYEPYFLEQYNKRSPSLLVSGWGPSLDIFELRHDDQIRQLYPISATVKSCDVVTNHVNGLVVLYQSFGKRPKNPTYFLLNPATRERSELVGVRPDCKDVDTVCCSLGFGFDSSSGKYKLVELSMMLDHSPPPIRLSCKVLTIGSKDWRFVCDVPYMIISFKAFFLNGALYWMVAPPPGYQCVHISALVFDIKEETFRVIPTPVTTSRSCVLPVEFGCKAYHIALREFGGQICLVRTFILPDQPFLKIWMLKDGDTTEWKLEYNIDMSGFSHQFEDPSAHIINIREGKILMQLSQGIFSYDIESKDYRKVYRFLFNEFLMPPLSLTNESFISPKKLLRNSAAWSDEQEFVR